MKYRFDKVVNREGTNSVKWEFMIEGDRLVQRKYSKNYPPQRSILPMWVADMDFPVPKPVVDALTIRAKHGIFGYAAPTDSYYRSIVHWMQKRHNWQVIPEWICITPGVVPALHMIIRTFVAPGNKVLIQTPVYHPFFNAITNNTAEIVTNPLKLENGRYTMDFNDLREKAKDPQVSMALLCSPHNPVGRVWTEDELTKFGEICLENNVLVVSDEIHGDLILNGNTFTPFARINEAFAENSIICTAPSKTFNVAGLKTSNIIIPYEVLRKKFVGTAERSGIFGVNSFGLVALQAAYDEGEEWLEQVIEYIEGNLRYLERTVIEKIPHVKLIPPEGTYLVWLDCRELGLDNASLESLMLEKAGVYLDQGYIFGKEGDGFLRINIACPRSVLKDAVERIQKAIKAL
ncbi:MAG: MalY/PatB family protein [Chloroflexota bacterium]|nr:MalY/PatB family protein [Chloroflexota bacterium]